MRILDMIMANKIRDGDVTAFETLMHKHKTKVFNYCLKFTSNYHLAEEITQEVFIKVYRNIDTYNWHMASLSTWIYTITHNTCINSLRELSFTAPLEEADTYQQAASAEQEFFCKERLSRLSKALQALNPDEKALILQKDYLGFKLKEISRILNIPVGTVKSRLHTIRNKLRGLVGDDYA